ncbi:hypothetical protein WOLCODRAFT_130410 [Wolfiporia cocos MD-104 SS10]|uniref:Transcription factor n=1 Tax=Wolfiporia cocos (strain MD-104) TaxID=742152 RepID=A0A2H3JFW6_WOLCO|nr:hypothetical protein WOLCODRAFT_130410 [Wolfiporia cocos MD-104 SS10]
MDREPREPISAPAPEQHNVKHEGEDGMPSTSDFVKKLYKMLEDTSWSHVVSWGPQGDCFVVKDMNEFTKSILPRMFKHSNFASFVRQLNKYDFHKVKNSDDNQFGEHSWTFRHPDFHVDRRDALENIKRKVPAARKSTGRNPASPSPPSATVEALQATVERLVRDQEELVAHVRNLESNYQNVLSEMVNFQRNMAQQDGLMQNLIQYFLQLENGKVKAEELSNPAGSGNNASTTAYQDANPFLPATEAQRMMGAYPDGDVARASLAQMTEISRRAEVAGMTFSATPASRQQGSQGPMSRIMAAAGLNVDAPVRPMSRQNALARIEELARNRPPSSQGQPAASGSGAGAVPAAQPQASGSGAAAGAGAGEGAFDAEAFLLGDAGSVGNYAPGTMSHEGLQVFTVGHLMPKSTLEDANGNWAFDPNALAGVVMPTPQGMGGDPEQEGEGERKGPYPIASFAEGEAGTSAAPSGRPGSAQKLRVRRSTYVPGWAVPPKVLLVDDDAVSRRLSSKFLQVFGCTIDVAVDGVGAVNKMNLEKYDLVLMDIVMPKLDGVSATSLIRQFDHMTPIISMTSNSKPNEIIKYYSSGMNDILPKPFTKDGLLDMLEKHLMHLKVIQTMQRVPRSVGIPPLNDAGFDQALAMQPAQPTGGFTLGDDDGKINPLAGMGLTDEQYTLILQNLVSGDSFMGVIGGIEESASGKRSLDDSSDGRDAKRSRFEVVE